MKLRDCLSDLPIRNLVIIARLYGVYRGQNPPKATMVERLTAALRRPESLESMLARLTPDQREALDALISAGGRMPWPAFRQRFGDIRPYQPWRDEAPRHPWQDPISPAEALAFLGLIYRSPRRPRSGQAVQILIPDDLLKLLPPPEEPAPPEPLLVTHEPAPLARGSILTDVALFISLLHREDIRPLWDRWLPPRYLRDLNQRLSVPQDSSQVRSELQTGRLRFVHFLAEAAGLVGLANGWLKPTPQAWRWLEHAPMERYAVLWTAWRDPLPTTHHLWQRYRLPGHEVDPDIALDILEVLLSYLADLPVQQWYAPDAFAETLVATEPVLAALPPVWRDDEVHDLGRETITALLDGPLTWWGVVSMAEQGGEPAFALTSLGRWLIAGDGPGPPAAEASIHVEPDLTILVPPMAQPRDLVRVEAMAEWQGWMGERRCYRLTRASLSRALSRSMSLQEMIDVLSRGQGEGLGAEQVSTLEAWAAETEAVRLRAATLLETRDTGRLQALSANRTIRECLRETLSPRAVVVAGDQIDRLVRALQRQEIWPLVDLPGREPSNVAAFDVSAAAYAWVAGQVYAQLGRWIELPQPMPVAVLDDLAAQMDEAMHAAARQAADDTIQRLAHAMDGWARFPMPGAGLPPEETLPVIERAITQGHPLRMTYWTAGRGERTVRTVDPYRIEWRGDIPFLIGYCHERQAERVFRVDRIHQIT